MMMVQTEQEYWAAWKGGALIDRSHLGRLEMSGADSLDLLHRLSTQDLGSLEAGQGAATVLTSDKGRIIDLVTVYHLGDRLLLVASPENQDAVARWLDKYTIIEDSTTRDVTSETALLAFFGPGAPRLVEAVAGRSLEELPLYHHVEASVNGVDVRLARAQEPAGGGFHVLLPRRADVDVVHEALREKGEGLGIRLISPEAYEMLRIEAGLWAFGKEMDERYNPLEARMGPFISFDKGCYIGQEVVARLDTYDKVQKHLMGLALPQGQTPPSGAKLQAEGKEAGFVTSSTLTPAFGGPIAMAYVRARHAHPGTRLVLEGSNGPTEAEVVALPFKG